MAVQPDALVAQFKYTVLLMPNGNDKITGAPVQEIKCATNWSGVDLCGAWMCLMHRLLAGVRSSLRTKA